MTAPLLTAFAQSPRADTCAMENKILCADALQLLATLPDSSVDICVFSPPYNIDKTAGRGMFKHAKFVIDFIANGYETYNDDMDETEYQTWLSSVVGECLRVSKGLVWVNHKTRYRNKQGIHPLSFLKFPFYSEIIWNRNSSMTLNAKRFAPSHEFVYGFGTPHYWNDDTNTLFSVWDITPPIGNNRPNHPCPYPPELIERLIFASCPENGIVFDPFMGSGTTAIAARNLGRKFIGCDLSPEYVNLANTRLQNTDAYRDTVLPTGERQLSLWRQLESA